MIEVRYKNTEEQWVDFSIYKMNSQSNKDRLATLRRNLFLGIGLFIGVLYCVLGIQEYSKGESPIFSIVLGVIFAGAGIFGYFKLPTYWIKRAKKNFKDLFKKNEKSLGRTIEVFLEKDGLIINRNKEKTKLLLNNITDVTEINNCLYVISNDNLGIVIPNNAFENTDDKINFKNTIMNNIK
ncbi:YcxB family protein [Clostridium botulinum]|nr:YcxB family protein [Clostridium botulinum]NFR13424.1 YcxB family protein [Clostridium botulinum]NFR42045.1 YcxB family protein [Clostridium botulinum]NFS50750.1 YcxB family protein [Clostridium botulinum]